MQHPATADQQLRSLDVVELLEPLRVRVEVSPSGVGTSLLAGSTMFVDLPVGTRAVVELSEGRWSETVLGLRFVHPGTLREFTVRFGDERPWPRVRKIDPRQMIFG